MTPATLLILGCGYTGTRVARKMASLGWHVICTNREQAQIPGVECIEFNLAGVAGLPHGMTVLHSIPPVSGQDEKLLETLQAIQPARVVYLSTTGVYGSAEVVDEHTPAAPESDRDQLRVATEHFLAGESWSHLILRPAAIYGPGRGVHESVRIGNFQIPSESRVVSRIHVDDLAGQAIAGLQSDLCGAFPVADEEPSTSLVVAQFSADFLGLELPSETTPNVTSGRRVDGSAVRRALRYVLQYPTFRQGVPASFRAPARSG